MFKHFCFAKTAWRRPHFFAVLECQIHADVAQLAEQLICNQQVNGSSPFIGFFFYMDGFPSGQRGQTVNLLAKLSKVRILPHPPLFNQIAFSLTEM